MPRASSRPTTRPLSTRLPGGLLTVERGRTLLAVNMGASSVPCPAGEVMLCSGPLDPGGTLRPDTALWLRR